MFIRNHWYVAAFAEQLGPAPLARTICGEAILLYRKSDGGAVAMHDGCPHRLVPLSIGMVEGDNIRCKYHGMVFSPTGRCLQAPGKGASLALTVERIYETAERYGMIWVWIGDAAADPAKLPDLPWLESPGWAQTRESFSIACDHRFVIDNLMDLTHEAYVHPETIGQTELMEAPVAARREADAAILERFMPDIDPPPYWAQMLGKPGRVDRWQVCRFTLPSTVLIDSGVAPVGSGGFGGDRAQGVTGQVINLITPSTEQSCYYFLIQARDFALDADAAMQARFNAAMRRVVQQDIEVLEAQQAYINAHPAARLRALNIDAGATYARLMMQRATGVKADSTFAGPVES
ncbi:(2Fe-2S)-binding protein [Sphingobium jiangsuense]|uniref:Vanillate O-demethylase monooxygenase subunit n=1 Tax=Sphingobium jiangsuense TaxID=870476 RepID=A0A7W6BM61_9SPHN|nr:aromatic ring-hydroxylating dioxygenase subunit alpha [Sphingobium jiangsuense]MBB3928384.1 vanillate O-demethylase monooxygenase subunit [Sphingobium jiangsuense]GLS99764.1 (2Fe-2S)-binding protein [Sphingobium jiangsuense]